MKRLLHQRFGKGKCLDERGPAKDARVRGLLNDRPHYVLGFRAPAEFFCTALESCAGSRKFSSMLISLHVSVTKQLASSVMTPNECGKSRNTSDRK